MHQSSTSTYTPNFTEIEETFCGRTGGRTFETHFIRLNRRSRPKHGQAINLAANREFTSSKQYRLSQHRANKSSSFAKRDKMSADSRVPSSGVAADGDKEAATNDYHGDARLFRTITGRAAVYLGTHCNIGSKRAFPTSVLER